MQTLKMKRNEYEEDTQQENMVFREKNAKKVEKDGNMVGERGKEQK